MIRARIKVFFFRINNMITRTVSSFNRLIIDFQPRALRLSDCGRRHSTRPKHERAWCFKSNFQQGKLGLKKKQWDRGGREASTKDLAGSSKENFNWLIRHTNLLLFLVTH